jgi:hypothetical protein
VDSNRESGEKKREGRCCVARIGCEPYILVQGVLVDGLISRRICLSLKINCRIVQELPIALPDPPDNMCLIVSHTPEETEKNIRPLSLGRRFHSGPKGCRKAEKESEL